MGKHGPKRLDRYLDIHETVMDRHRRDGFIVDDDLKVEVLVNLIAITGTIKCHGGVRIAVRKNLQIVGFEGTTPVVRTVDYSYSVVLTGKGNIVRYCAPHSDTDGVDHHPHHHVHRFDVWADDEHGAVTLFGDDAWPTLSEVFKEVQGWCADNAERLATR
jgi:hypothetical protein